MVAQTPPRPCRTCGQEFAEDVLICPNDGAHLPLDGRLLDGKFRLDRRLGHGGMATVWHATNEFIERPVAIKLMHTSYAADVDLLARFRNEATAAGRIGSPHICDVLDFGRSAIGPYIVMELLSGVSLSDLMQAYRQLDPGLAVWIMRQALEGLHAAHRAGIVHRDLKPENIHLSRAIRDQWVVKLMDFGISKFVDSMRTGAGTMMGSPNYMAPEQIHGAAAVDARADVWSIGAILYEALTGEQAFGRETVADSLAAVRNFDPPLCHTLAPDVPPGLSEIVARCLRKSIDQRWPSAAALADALLPYEKPGPRARLMPTTPVSDVPRPNTLPKSGAVPRALADADRPPSGPHPGPSARSGGGQQPGPPARSGSPQAPRVGAQPGPDRLPATQSVLPARSPAGAPPRAGSPGRPAGPSGAFPPVSPARSPAIRPLGPSGAADSSGSRPVAEPSGARPASETSGTRPASETSGARADVLPARSASETSGTRPASETSGARADLLSARAPEPPARPPGAIGRPEVPARPGKPLPVPAARLPAPATPGSSARSPSGAHPPVARPTGTTGPQAAVARAAAPAAKASSPSGAHPPVTGSSGTTGPQAPVGRPPAPKTSPSPSPARAAAPAPKASSSPVTARAAALPRPASDVRPLVLFAVLAAAGLIAAAIAWFAL